MRWPTLAIAAGTLALAAGPWLFGGYFVDLVTELLVLALFALSLDLMFGYATLYSFGHAAFFGVGAYTAAMVVNAGHVGFWGGLAAGILGSASVGLVMGLFAVRSRGPIYIILTLLLSSILFSLAHVLTGFTGGENGISITRPLMLWPGTSIRDGSVFYWLVLGVTAGALALCVRVTRSPFGRVLVAIRENEARTQAMGYNTSAFKFWITLISAALAGLAGALNAYMNKFVSPESLGIVFSTQVVIWTLLGGMGTLIGPMLGAAVLIVLTDVLNRLVSGYLILIGVVFILTVIFLPGGLVTLVPGVGRRRAEPASSSSE